MNEITLETERLLLRWLREDDFKQYAKMCRDPEVMRFLGGQTLTDIEVWRQMAYFMGHWYFRGYGIWAVEEKSTGNLIGRIGFLNPIGWPAFELGWTLSRESWHKGYATEGARRALAAVLARSRLYPRLRHDPRQPCDDAGCRHLALLARLGAGEGVRGDAQHRRSDLAVLGDPRHPAADRDLAAPL